MATLIDSIGTQHYANKMVLAENRKVGSKSLPTALADVDKLIDEMKGLFEGEYGSSLDMKLENNENIFSVGIGSGVDKSNDVENSFTDLEIFGETAYNMVQMEPVDIYGTSGRGRIDRSHTQNGCLYTTRADTESYITVRTRAHTLMKPNTVYTLMFSIVQNTFDWDYKGITVSGWGDSYFGAGNAVYHDMNFSTTAGVKIIKFTTPADISSFTGFGFGFPNIITQKAGMKFAIERTMLLEGDYTNKPYPPYIKGIASLGEKENKIDVLSIGENKVSFPDELVYTLDNRHFGSYGYRLPIKGKKFSYRYDYEIISISQEQSSFYSNLAGDSNTRPEEIVLDVNMSTINQRLYPGAKGTVVINGKSHSSALNILDFRCIRTKEPVTMVYKITNFALYFKDSADTYIPAITDKRQVLLDGEPLRSLPNGTRDSIELKDGKARLIRRIGKCVLDGSEQWAINSGMSNENYITMLNTAPIRQLKILKTPKVCNYYLIDKYPDNTIEREAATFEHTSGSKHATAIFVRLKVTSTQEFINKIKSKPIVFYYQLDTPIVKELSITNPRCWKGGSIFINTVVPPVTTHTVSLNKPAQIKRNIEELTVLRNKVSALEEQYDQIALEQAHKLELLNHSFELDYNI